MITFEQGIRFLGDYLEGDIYYKVPPDASSNFNLIRARNQFTLLASMETVESEMKDIVDSILAQHGDHIFSA